MKKLLASLIDQVIVFGGAAILLLLFTLIVKVIGFEFVKSAYTVYAYIISVAIVAILYFPIVESTKLNATIGKKLLNA